jgi:hypothetical protein
VSTWLDKLAYRLSRKRRCGSLVVAVFLPVTDDESERLFGLVSQALALVRQYAPIRYARLERDIEAVFVFGGPDCMGQYQPDLHFCELSTYWLTRPDVVPEAVAATIVHEAEHARLWRFGFRYEPEVQARIERLCFRASRAFCNRLPSGEEHVEAASAGMCLPASTYDADSRAERRERALELLAVENAVVRPLVWMHRQYQRLSRKRMGRLTTSIWTPRSSDDR